MFYSYRYLAPILACAALTACGSDGGEQSTTSAVSKDFQSRKAVRIEKSADPASYATAVQAMYVAYFGRPADPSGLASIEAALAADNAPTDIAGLCSAYATDPTVQSLVNNFGYSQESNALYGTSDPSTFVKDVFQHVLGRQPLQAGLTYWSTAIASGALTQGDAALAIMAGALGNTTAQGKLDAQLIDNRLALASYFTAQVTGQNAAYAYVGASAAADGRNLLNAVTATTDISSYQNTVTSDVAALKASYVVTTNATLAVFAGNMNVAGSADGLGSAASFNTPFGLTRDGAGNLYVSDAVDDTIRKITPAGAVTTLAGTAGTTGSADGTGHAASFNLAGIAADSAGNIYVADDLNEEIRKVSPAGVVTTVAGLAGVPGSSDGTGSAARFHSPVNVALDNAGNLYIADVFNNTIRKMTPSGVVTTVAGIAGVKGSTDGASTAATFNNPVALAVDSFGNIYVADAGNSTIREISASGTVRTVAGQANSTGTRDGEPSYARFVSPSGIALDSNGNVYVSDEIGMIRKISNPNIPYSVVTTVAGTPNGIGFVGGPLPGVLNNTFSIVISGRTMYVATNHGVAVINNLP